ncbi:DNA-binding protein [Sinorhizobium fredii]|uniref:helix-turn-helix transcriptional regulator n=1 Tax=Rhizobium fredii TaxID=380 RepID=UPI003099E4BB
MASTISVPEPDDFLPARRVWERYGVTQMTLWRWLHDDKMRFPQPVYFGRRRYFRLSDIESWERQRITDSGAGVPQ